MEFEPITTKEQLDKVIEEHIKKEKEKYGGYEDYKRKAEEYDALELKCGELEETVEKLNGDIGDSTGRISGFEEKIRGYEMKELKTKIAQEVGIPFNLAEKLAGEDEEAIRKDAENMARYVSGTEGIAPLASTEPQTVDSKKAAIKNMVNGLKGE